MKTLTITAVALTALAAPVLAAGPLVTVDELNAMLGDENLAIIDVRSRVGVDAKVKGLPDSRNFAKGHIPGAVNGSYTSTSWRADQGQIKAMLANPGALEGLIKSMGVDNDDHVVIYTSGTSPKGLDLGSATRVYWTFKALGHDNVSILDGGFDGWVKAGYELSTDAAKPEPGNFTAKLNTDMLIDGAMVELAVRNDIELIDSRPPTQFAGTAQSGMAKNPGTIETATNVPAASLVGDGGVGFKSLDALKAQFNAAGFEEGEKGYAFCNTGHFASATWFVASELLGYDVELYDGSMYDWTYVRDGRTVIGKMPTDEKG